MTEHGREGFGIGLRGERFLLFLLPRFFDPVELFQPELDDGRVVGCQMTKEQIGVLFAFGRVRFELLEQTREPSSLVAVERSAEGLGGRLEESLAGEPALAGELEDGALPGGHRFIATPMIEVRDSLPLRVRYLEKPPDCAVHPIFVLFKNLRKCFGILVAPGRNAAVAR